MTDERDFEAADITEDSDAVDAAPVEADDVPDVREDPITGEDDASAGHEAPEV